MSTLACVTKHLELDEIFRRYRDCECVVEKVHWQVIWLRSQGKKTAEVAALTGFNTDWIRRLIRRYNELGPSSLGDRRKNNGNDPILSDIVILQAEVNKVLDNLFWRLEDLQLSVLVKCGVILTLDRKSTRLNSSHRT